MTQYVLNAQPYREGAMGPEGDAENMLICQYQFPHEYDRLDVFFTRELQRLLDGDRETVKDHIWDFQGDLGELEEAFRKSDEQRILNFLKELLGPEQIRPGIKWTGYRVLGTVREGKPIYTLILFAKHKDTRTPVYSGDDAPNVRGHGGKVYF